MLQATSFKFDLSISITNGRLPFGPVCSHCGPSPSADHGTSRGRPPLPKIVGGHDRDHDHDREARHDHDQPLSPPLSRSPHFYFDCGTPTQEGRTSTGWKFPLKSFWLRSHFGSRKLHATKVFCCQIPRNRRQTSPPITWCWTDSPPSSKPIQMLETGRILQQAADHRRAIQ